jgi:hypothetical protein
VTYIYCLFSTTDGRPRYIGQTCEAPPVRQARHLRDAERRPYTRLHRWIHSVVAAGFQVRIYELQSHVQPRDLDLFVRYWMAQFRGLLNVGVGMPGVTADTEVARAVQKLLRKSLQAAGPAILGTKLPSTHGPLKSDDWCRHSDFSNR